MSRLLEMVEDQAHQRTITVTTHKAGAGRAVIEGRLTDRRNRENYLLTGEKLPAGDIHDMIVRLLVDTESLTIEDVEVELVTVPRHECLELRDSLSGIKGVRIWKGFTGKIRSLLGGVNSCSHLKELVEAMGPAAIQGVFSLKAGNRAELSALMDDRQIRRTLAQSMVNTCYVWRESGPEYKRVFGLLSDMQKGS